jgi:acyl-CoA synthetase (AMP-forming)/AMP-acid ligase II
VNATTLFDRIASISRADPERLAVCTSGSTASYGQLRDLMESRARAMRKEGIGHGTRVILSNRDPIGYIVAFGAITSLHSVPVIVDPHGTSEELADLTSRVGATWIMHDAHLVKTGDGHGGDSACFPLVEMGAIFLTSGSTGRQQAIAHSRRALMSALTTLADTRGSVPQRWLTAIPLATIGGHTIATRVIGAGDILILSVPFKPGSVIRHVATHRIDRLCLTPAMLGVIVRSHRRGLVPTGTTVGSIGVGAGRLPNGLRAEAESRFGTTIVNTYGSTELGGAALRAGSASPAAFYPLPGCRVRVTKDDHLAECDEVGRLECWVPAPPIGRVVAPSIIEPLLDSKGWYRTDDLARSRKDGAIELIGRAGDIADRGGYLAYAGEAERVIAEHSDVREVAVVVRNTDRGYDELLAFVVPHDRAPVQSRDLHELCSVKLRAWECPDRIVLCKDLPRGHYGKVARDALLSRALL